MVKKCLHWLIYRLLFRQFLQLIMGVHYRNREVLENTGQCIIVSNHNSHLDTMALLAALPWRHIGRTKPVAAGDYFGKTPLKKYIIEFLVNTLLIPRNRPKEGENTPDPIDLMINELKSGYSLIVFPEGTRGEPGKMQKFKKGIGIIMAQRPDLPIVPVYMQGMGRLLPKGEAILVPFDNVVCFGAPIFCQNMTVEEIVACTEKAVNELVEEK
jgi:1-acyl-sn-glycerol-3-phosphate acyltransferase